MKIAILIPLFNGIEFLEECLQSVLQQTYQEWEVWIGVNGHGNDGGDVAKVAQKWVDMDPRIHVLIQDDTIIGKVESLNHLMKDLPDEFTWIALLDCDDKWTSDKLEKQIRAMEGPAMGADVIGTHCQIFGDRTSSPYLPSGFISPDVLEQYNPVINSSSLIRREWCNWEYTPLCMAMEDYSLWMKICLAGGRLYNLPEKLTWHRVYSTSAFNSKMYSNDGLREWYSSQLHSKGST